MKSSPFDLPEFSGNDPDSARLVVLIQHPPTLDSLLIQELEELFSGLTCRTDPHHRLILLEAPPGIELNGFLSRLGRFITDWSRKHPNRPAPEILESRLVDRDLSGSTRPEGFSRLIKLLREETRTTPGENELILSCGASFGSGIHPSTRLAMRAIEDIHAQTESFPASVLDVGCGSGILGLSCAVLGTRTVRGIDISAAAVDVARENAAKNQLADRVSFDNTPLELLSGPYALITANLTAAVIGGMTSELSRLTAPGGQLIISGLQGRQQQEMATVLSRTGFRIQARYQEAKWRALLLTTKNGGPEELMKLKLKADR